MVRYCGPTTTLIFALSFTLGDHAKSTEKQTNVARKLIVKFRSFGPHALTERAASLLAGCRLIQSVTADRSDTIDKLNQTHRVSSARRLFIDSISLKNTQPETAWKTLLEQNKLKFNKRAESEAQPGAAQDLSNIFVLELSWDAGIEELSHCYQNDPHLDFARPVDEIADNGIDDEKNEVMDALGHGTHASTIATEMDDRNSIVVAENKVVWKNIVGASATTHSLFKTVASGWGNSGAVSTEAISSGDGFVEFNVDQTTTAGMCGLSNGDNNQNYTDIDYAIYMDGAGNLSIYERGIHKAFAGVYSVGDWLRIAVEAGVVKYLKNGTLLYTSTLNPLYPLLVDTALYTPGATISHAFIRGTLVPADLECRKMAN